MILESGYNKGGRKILAAIRVECGRLGALVGEIGGSGNKAHAVIEFGGARRKVFFPSTPPGAILNRSRAARHRVKEAVREIEDEARRKEAETA